MYTLKIDTIRQKKRENRAEKRKGEKHEGKAQKETSCFDGDQEKEGKIGELDEDMRKHRLMRKKRGDKKGASGSHLV